MGAAKRWGTSEIRNFAPSWCVLTTAAFASGLIVAIGACAPIHPRVGQSGPPGPRVRAGSLSGHGSHDSEVMSAKSCHRVTYHCAIFRLGRPDQWRLLRDGPRLPAAPIPEKSAHALVIAGGPR